MSKRTSGIDSTKMTAFVIALSLVLVSCARSDSVVNVNTTPQTAPFYYDQSFAQTDGLINAAVVYDSHGDLSKSVKTLSYLRQSLTIGITISEMDASVGLDTQGFDLLYLDESLIHTVDGDRVREAIKRFISNGGICFIPAALTELLGHDVLGIEAKIRIPQLSAGSLSRSEHSDFTDIQSLFIDYFEITKHYPEESLLLGEYGFAFKTNGAISLIDSAYGSLCFYVEYGYGKIICAGALLPDYTTPDFSLEYTDQKETSFAGSTASFNQMLLGEIAAYCQMSKYGLSLERVFGSFGTPSMSWELHVEELTGLRDSAAQIFGDMCRDAWQIPSYSLVRSSYKWFTRSECVTYLLGGGETDLYKMDYDANAYSSGRHIVEGEAKLAINEFPDTGSYFLDRDDLLMRAYPAVGYYNADNIPDLICGSSDGYFYYFEGTGFSGGYFNVKERIRLCDSYGVPLKLESYSAPTVADVDGDGIFDIVSGCSDGKLYWFRGARSNTVDAPVFEFKGLLCDFKVAGYSMPYISEEDGDSLQYLLVGSTGGGIFKSVRATQSESGFSEFSSVKLPEGETGWAAPCVINGRIAFGTQDGYVRFTDGSYLKCNEVNYKGNDNLMFAKNIIPRFFDLNGDGKDDIIAGTLEMGPAYAIDDALFPYQNEVQSFVDYCKANGYYLGTHFYTTEYSSREREDYELNAHIKALLHYGVDLSFTGTNHHTWRTSSLSPTQTFEAEWDAGLLWDSGFSPPSDWISNPHVSAKNAVALPFFLTNDEGDRTILLQNVSLLPEGSDYLLSFSAKYNMPILVYYHCDFADTNTQASLNAISRVEEFRVMNGYNFVSERQMMFAISAAYAIDATVAAEDGKVTISPIFPQNNYALYEAGYAASCGIKVTFSEQYKDMDIQCDADVLRKDGRSFYISANKDVTFSAAAESLTRIERVNIAAYIQRSGHSADIAFADGGYMEVVVHGEASTANQGWSVTMTDGKTIFRKFGDAQTLQIGW